MLAEASARLLLPPSQGTLHKDLSSLGCPLLCLDAVRAAGPHLGAMRLIRDEFALGLTFANVHWKGQIDFFRHAEPVLS